MLGASQRVVAARDTAAAERRFRGLATQGTGGQNEPSLQRIFDLYQLGIRTGDANSADTNLFGPSAPLGANDELFAQRLVKRVSNSWRTRARERSPTWSMAARNSISLLTT